MEQFLDSLPPAIVLPVSLGIAVLGLLSRFLKFKPALKALIEELRIKTVSYERVDKAVEDLLRQGKPVTPFIDWVGDVVASFATQLPEWKEYTWEKRVGIISSLFGKLAKAKALTLVKVDDDVVLTDQEARKIVAMELLRKLDGKFRDIVGGR
jgi:hypothetical protein